MPYAYPEDGEELQICSRCIAEAYLKERVARDGRKGACSYCGLEGATTTLQVLADQVHDVFTACFVQTGDDGYEIEELISSTAGVSEDITRDVRSYLSDLHGHQAALDGEDDPYAEEAYYEQGRPNGYEYSRAWHDFRQRLLEQSRFFMSDAAPTLETIFGDLTRWFGAVREIKPGDHSACVYRARITDHNGLQAILANPARELGAPPSRATRAGRMNAAGISVFYGAEDIETCLAELRAPIASTVVAGKFRFLRPVRLLDLNVLATTDKIVPLGSLFDADARQRRERAAFFRQLVAEVSHPVMPTDEAMDYLPSQAIAEFLASRSPPLDGIVFSSSQTGGKGRNVVLFHHASRVKDEGMTDVAIDWNDGPEDDPDGAIRVSAGSEPHPFSEVLEFSASRQTGPTLCIAPGSIRVLHIAGVRYDYGERSVQYARRKPPG